MTSWTFWILAFIASAAIVCFGPPIAFLLVIACWITAIGSWYPLFFNRAPEQSDSGQAERLRPGFNRIRKLAIAGSIMALLACVSLSLSVLSRLREYATSAITVSNLRGIGYGTQLYAEKFGGYPRVPDDLVREGFSTWGQFYSVGDADVPYPAVGGRDPEYSSFTFCPGAGPWQREPDITLAFERQAWTPQECRMFPAYGRCVLFGDGNVRVLNDDELATARRRDAARRAELGWPTP